MWCGELVEHAVFVSWIADQFPDVEADFRVIYNFDIDFTTGEFAGLTSQKFFNFCKRLIWYDGTVRRRIEHQAAMEQAEEVKKQTSPNAAPRNGFKKNYDNQPAVDVPAGMSSDDFWSQMSKGS